MKVNSPEMVGIREVYDKYVEFYSNRLYTFHREAALQVLRMYDVLKRYSTVSREDTRIAEHAYYSLHGGSASYYSCESINEELVDALLYKFGLSDDLVIPEYPSGYITIDEVNFIDSYCILLDETKFDSLREKYADIIKEYRESGVTCKKIRIVKYYAKLVDVDSIDKLLERYKRNNLHCELDPDFGPKDNGNNSDNLLIEALINAAEEESVEEVAEEDDGAINTYGIDYTDDTDNNDDTCATDDAVDTNDTNTVIDRDAQKEVTEGDKADTQKKKKQKAKIYIEIPENSRRIFSFRTCIVKSSANPTIRGGKIKFQKGSILAQLYGLEKPSADRVAEIDY